MTIATDKNGTDFDRIALHHNELDIYIKNRNDRVVNLMLLCNLQIKNK